VAGAVTAHRCTAIHARILASLQALGCDDDARLAFHAEAAGDGPAALHHASAAARRAAALASHREAVAQFERALRFADEADPRAAASLHDGFAYEASLLDRWQDAAGARQRALALWRDVGDPLREGDTLRWLAFSLCSLSQGDAAIAVARDAIALLEPMGQTAELAWAYATLASMWMVRGVNEDAIKLARRAEAIAWPLGLSKVLSSALNTEACAIRVIGGEWAHTLRQSLDIALAGRHEAEVARAYVNLHACYVADRDWAAAERYFSAGIAYCDDRDITTYSIYLRSERTSVLERTGRWDEAVALCRDLLRQGGPSPGIRVCPLNRLAMIQARWPVPRHSGWRASWLRPAARPNWPTTRPAAATHGIAGRSRSGCGVPARTGRPAVSLPRPTSGFSTATGPARPASGPTWAAGTRPRWPCLSQPTKPRCAAHCGPSSTSARRPPSGSPGRRCAGSPSGRSRPAPARRRGSTRSG